MRNICFFNWLLIIINALCFGMKAHAQPSPTWTRMLQLGGAHTEQVLATVVDAQGNVYQTGYFMDSTQCGQLVLPMAASATYDLYLMKRDSQGGLLWVKYAGSQSNEKTSSAHKVYGTARGNQLALDAVGNVYVTGFFRGEITFGNPTNTLTALAAAPAAFIAKYSPQGTVIWTRKAQATLEVDATGLTVAPNGDIFVAGYFKGGLTIGSSTLNSLSGSNDVFLAKYSSSGILQWAQQAGGPADDYGYSVQADSSGGAYLTGNFTGYLSASNKIITGYGKSDIFVARYNSIGVAQWLRAFGGPGQDYAGALAIAPNGEVYSTGSFSNTAQFGASSLTSAGGLDGFLLKCDAQGIPVWVKQMSGSADENTYLVAIHPTGSVYVSGSFEGTSLFTTQSLTSIGSSDVFLARYESTGNLSWVTKGGGNSNEVPGGLSCTINGELELAIQFFGTASFGNFIITSKGGYDVLFLHLQDNMPF